MLKTGAQNKLPIPRSVRAGLAQQVIDKILNSGYTHVTKLEAEDDRWEGEGLKNGQKMEFHADPKTGVITSEELDD